MATYIIDTENEMIPSEYAKMQGISMSAVSNLIKNQKIKFRYIKELDLKLIKLGSEPEDRITKRKNKFNNEKR